MLYAEMDSVVMPALDQAAQTTLEIREVMAQAELDVAAIFKERETRGLAGPLPTETPMPVPAPTPRPATTPTPPLPTATPTQTPLSNDNSALKKLENAASKAVRWIEKNLIKKGVFLPPFPFLPKLLTERRLWDFEGLQTIIEKALSKTALKNLSDKAGESFGKLLFRNAGKAIPIPLVDLVVDMVVNTGFNVLDNIDLNKGFYASILENDKFWASMMKDTAFSVASLALKTGIVATATGISGAMGTPAGGVGGLVTGALGFLASSSGAGAVSSVTMLIANIAVGDQVKEEMVRTGIPQGITNLFKGLREWTSPAKRVTIFA